MISYKTIYLICIILCFMGYTDGGLTTEEQKLCRQNIREDFDYPRGTLTSNKLTLPKQAFQNRVLDQFKSIHGLNYFQTILEKASTSKTESPKTFCSKTGFSFTFSPTLCMDQLNEVYEIADENDALSVIKWTYVNKKESDIPQVFDATNGDEVKRFEHFAYTYFKHMLRRLDVYISIPWPMAFCQKEEPYYRDKNQNYRFTSDENPGESSEGEITVRQQLYRARASKRPRTNSEIFDD